MSWSLNKDKAKERFLKAYRRERDKKLLELDFEKLGAGFLDFIGAGGVRRALGDGKSFGEAYAEGIKEGVKQATKAGAKQAAKIGSIEGAVLAQADNYGRQSARINKWLQQNFDLGH